MSEALSSIRNIGPAMEAAFKNAGIENADALRDHPVLREISKTGWISDNDLG